MPVRHIVALALAFGVALQANAAGANGRFPRAQKLIERSGDPQKLLLSATYGLLVSDDGGAEWRHVCELGFAFAVAEIDPLAAVFSDDSMIVKGTRSLNRAPPPFCAFEPVLGGMGTDTVADFALDAATPDRVLALFMSRGETGLTVNRLFESVDAGRTFQAYGAPLPESDVAFGITLDISPNDASRLYATATGRDGAGLFARSDDAGETWSTSVLALAPDEYPYIAAVHPTNSDAVFVRTDLWAYRDEGIDEADDALLYSDDGGLSFRELIRRGGKLLGFALSPDGGQVLVAYGDPVEPARTVDESVLGIYRASTADFAFTKIYDGSVSCLAWTERGVYACTSQADNGFALGIAPDADFELGMTDVFAPLLDLTTVRPIECPACTSGAACQETWPDTCALFESCDAPVATPASGGSDCGGAGGTSSGGSGGAGGAANGGAASGGSPGGGTVGRGGASNNAVERARESKSNGACGCRALGRPSSASTWWFFVILAAALRCRVSHRVEVFSSGRLSLR
jgi:hypothetical protein